MSTFAEQLRTLETWPKKVAYNTQIRIAQKLINNLCKAADEKIELSTYNIVEQKGLLLPSVYVFHNFSLKFLPFWGSCYIVLEDRELSVRLPGPWEKFSQYLEKIRLFADEYVSLDRVPPTRAVTQDEWNKPQYTWETTTYKPLPKLSEREVLVIQFQNEMRDF